MDGHPVARAQTAADQPPGQGIGLFVPLREGQRPDVDDGVGRPVRELLGHAAQMLVDQHAVGCPPDQVS